METRCSKKATIFVKAFGDRGWEGYFCRKHSTEIIQMRIHLVIRHSQNVVVRPVKPYDKTRVRKADKIKKVKK
jgi:hypothetical protein